MDIIKDFNLVDKNKYGNISIPHASRLLDIISKILMHESDETLKQNIQFFEKFGEKKEIPQINIIPQSSDTTSITFFSEIPIERLINVSNLLEIVRKFLF